MKVTTLAATIGPISLSLIRLSLLEFINASIVVKATAIDMI